MQRHLLQDAMSFESKKALLFLKNLGENSQQSLNNLTLKSIALIVLASQKTVSSLFSFLSLQSFSKYIWSSLGFTENLDLN